MIKNISEEKRRESVSFDAFYFEKMREMGKIFSMQDTFSHIADINLWGSSESVSGEGSTYSETRTLKNNLINLLIALKIKTVLDAPCGDFQWFSSIVFSIEKYIGVDIEKNNIEKLKNLYQNKTPLFKTADICETKLDRADLILCRDCLVHFSYCDIKRAIRNFKNTGSTYLLTTTFSDANINMDITTGDWRTLNLQIEPFNFPKPINIITEGCKQNDGLYQDKSLALWRLNDLRVDF